MQRLALTAAITLAMSLSLAACKDASEAYTPVDELPSAQPAPVSEPAPEPAPMIDPAPTDPLVPPPVDPALPPAIDPMAPPVDETQRAPPSPEDPLRDMPPPPPTS